MVSRNLQSLDSYIVNTMEADDLAPCITRSSAVMILTLLSQKSLHQPQGVNISGIYMKYARTHAIYVASRRLQNDRNNFSDN